MSSNKDQDDNLEILMEKLRKPLYVPPPLDNRQPHQQQSQVGSGSSNSPASNSSNLNNSSTPEQKTTPDIMIVKEVLKSDLKSLASTKTSHQTSFGNADKRVTVRDLLEARRAAKQSQEESQPLEKIIEEEENVAQEVQAPDFCQQSQAMLHSREEQVGEQANFAQEIQAKEEVQLPDVSEECQLSDVVENVSPLPELDEGVEVSDFAEEVEVSDLAGEVVPDSTSNFLEAYVDAPIVNEIDDVPAVSNFDITPHGSNEMGLLGFDWRLQSVEIIHQGNCLRLKGLVPYGNDGNPIQLEDNTTEDAEMEHPLFSTDDFPRDENLASGEMEASAEKTESLHFEKETTTENDEPGVGNLSNDPLDDTRNQNEDMDEVINRICRREDSPSANASGEIEGRQNLDQQTSRESSPQSSSSATFMQRKRRRPRRRPDERFVCEFCQSEFYQRYRLRIHREIHTSESSQGLHRCSCENCNNVPFRDYRTMKRFHNVNDHEMNKRKK